MKHDYKKILLWTLVCTLILSFTNYRTALSESSETLLEVTDPEIDSVNSLNPTDNKQFNTENKLDETLLENSEHGDTSLSDTGNKEDIVVDSAEESNDTVGGSNVSNDTVDESKDDKYAVDLLLDGEGVESNPYLIYDFKDLETALASVKSKEETLFVKLMDDIKILNSITRIKSNLVVDGNDKVMYRDFTSNSIVLRTDADGITIKLKNLTHGSEELGNYSTYYGVITIMNKDVTLIVENFTYDSKRASQPFYADKAGAYLILKGDNYFNQTATAYGGEFIERFESVVVEDGTTTIMNYGTGNEYSNFKNVNSIRVNKDATLYVETNRRDFADSTTPIILEENADFKFVSAYTGTTAYLRIGDVTLARDAKFEIQVGGGKINSSSINFTVDNPDYILLSHQDITKTPLSNKNKWTITQDDTSEQYYYGISKTEKGIQTDTIDYGESGVFESINSVAQVKPEIKATFDSAIYTKVPIFWR